VLADYDRRPGSNHTLCPPLSSIAPNAWQGRRLSRSKNLIFELAVAMVLREGVIGLPLKTHT
jgi:hypothetical protein